MRRSVAAGFALVVSGLGALSGCAEITLQNQGGQLDRTFVGYVRVKGVPAGAASLPAGGSVTEFSATGLSAGTGVTLGYSRERLIEIPMDCRVLIIVEPGAVLPPGLSDALKQAAACQVLPSPHPTRSLQ